MHDNYGKIGPFRLNYRIARGGMGVVYKGQHEETGELAAIKTVILPNANLLQSIRREIHALACLHHPGIINIVDEGVIEGFPWYAMDYIEAPLSKNSLRNTYLLRK